MSLVLDTLFVNDPWLADRWNRMNGGRDPQTGEWRAGLYWILTRSSEAEGVGRKVRFKPNWAQRQFFRSMHYWNLILKARQLGFCLDPKTRVLTADLQWMPIGEIQPGQRLVAVDEYPPGGRGAARCMRTATVQGVVPVKRQAYRITLEDGRSVVCTGQHPWLSRKVATDATWRAIESDTRKKLLVGTRIRSVTAPWSNGGYEDGWFGGFLDGEGSLNGGGCGTGINVSQVPGAAFDRAEDYLRSRGYHYRIETDKRKAGDSSKLGSKEVRKLVVSRGEEVFRLIGQTRPTRFVGREWWAGKGLPGKKTGYGWSKVVAIEPVGEQWLVDLQTSTGTYIAEGLVSHNTTFICLLFLDAILFEQNIRAGIVAHDLDSAKGFFREKVLYPYLQLPKYLRDVMPTDTKSKSELSFVHSNGLIRVGTSLRSGTYDMLHVSEFGKVCARWPDKAKEIVTGTLQTAHAGSFVNIESTAEGREGAFFDYCVKAQAAQAQGKALGPTDFKFHFLPWWQEPSYVADPLTVVVTPEDEAYFSKLETKLGRLFSDGQKAWYVAKKDKLGDDIKREFPSTWEEAFEASIEGTYLARQFSYLRKQGRIREVPWLPSQRVHTSWDIGRNDTNVIWFLQRKGALWSVLDVYANSHEGAPHYVKVLNEKPYVYGDHYVPHDGAQHDWGTNVDRKRTLEDLGLRNVHIVPRTTEFDLSVEHLRTFITQCEFDERACKDGIAHLERWRKDWNEKLGVWLSGERHDEASHYAAALRTIADAHPRPASQDAEERKAVARHNEELDKESRELWG